MDLISPATTSLYENPASYWNTCLRLRRDALDRVTSFKGNPLSSTDTQCQKIIEDEIDAVVAMLQTLRAHRNTTSAVVKLPFDILVLIFEQCQKDSVSSQQDQESGYFPTTNPSYPLVAQIGWIACSQVCRRWREVALAAPSLWKHIFVSLGPRWLQCSLARSQGAPGIHLFGYLTSAYHTILNRMPPVHLFDAASISSLSLTALKPDDLYLLFKDTFFRYKAPILEVLELTVSSPNLHHHGRLHLGEIINNSPSLRDISFFDFIPKWTPLPTSSSTLTSLEIIFYGNYEDPMDSSLPCIGSVVEFLRFTPALEYLALEHCLGYDPNTINLSSGRTVDLPHLQQLALITHAAQSFYFLRHVKIPTTSRVRVSVESESWLGTGSVSSLINQAFRFFDNHAPTDAPTGSLAFLVSSSWTQVIAHAGRDALPFIAPQEPCDMDTHANISFHARTRDSHDILHTVCNALPYSFVDTLMVQGVDIQMCEELSQRFPRASTIICPGKYMAAVLFEALSPLPNRPVPFPNLEVLIIQGPADTFLYVPDSKLYRTLKLRQERGCPLKWLRLDLSCMTRKRWLDALLKVVHRVDMFRIRRGGTIEQVQAQSAGSAALHLESYRYN